jgi:pyruvate dehydrogenase E2 component (dihydrolipoamide acetyltransferase)
MNAMMRRPTSPYARRLAREQGLALENITGSGPNGRIVAADIEAFGRARQAAAPAATTTVTAASPVSVSVSAYAIAIDLGKLQRLLADFGGAQVELTLDDMLVRAGALALEAVPGANPGGEIAVGWETGNAATRRETVIAEPHKGLISALHRRLLDAAQDGAAGLSMRRIAQAGIRPTALPLLPGHRLRLVIVAGDADIAAECLLSFDAAAIGEDDAAAFLARFRDGLETPLRLLA